MASRLHPRARVRVTCQYGALSPLAGQTDLPFWWRGLKVDFWSLSAWHVGMYGWMTLVIFVFFGCIEAVADRVLVPDAVSEGVRIVPVLSDELAVDKTWHQDGNLAQRPFVARESALTIRTLYNKVLHKDDETGRLRGLRDDSNRWI